MWSLSSNSTTSVSTEQANGKKPINTAIKKSSAKTEKRQPLVKLAAPKPAVPKTQKIKPPVPNTPKPTPLIAKPRRKSSAEKPTPVLTKPKTTDLKRPYSHK